MGNIALQCSILNHLIKRVQIEIRWILYGEGHSTYAQTLLKDDLHHGPPSEKSEKTGYIGFEHLSIMYYCFEEDIKHFAETLEIERVYCNKIKHAFDLTSFILSVKPFVCLNYDAGGFNLVRQDKCDKHQANPLLTGQLLFGIVNTSNQGPVPAAGQPPQPMKNLKGAPLQQPVGPKAGMNAAQAKQDPGAAAGGKDKLKHY